MVCADIGLNFLEHLLLDLHKLEFFFVGGNKLREGMFAYHSAVSVADQSLQALLRSRNRAAKTREEKLRLINLPAHINHYEQIVAVGSQHLLEFALEIVDAVVEFVNLLHWPGQLEIRSRLGDWPRRPAEGGHDRYFGGTHLKSKEQQHENQEEDKTDDKGKGISHKLS